MMNKMIVFFQKAKARHAYDDMLQVRYTDGGGEHYDTWVSGDEVAQRLKSQSREALIRHFASLNLTEAKREASKAVDEGKRRAKRGIIGRFSDALDDQIGGNAIGDALVNRVRGQDNSDPRERQKQMWQSRLQDEAFRLVLLEVAYRNLELSLPDEAANEPDDWM